MKKIIKNFKDKVILFNFGTRLLSRAQICVKSTLCKYTYEVLKRKYIKMKWNAQTGFIAMRLRKNCYQIEKIDNFHENLIEIQSL